MKGATVDPRLQDDMSQSLLPAYKPVGLGRTTPNVYPLIPGTGKVPTESHHSGFTLRHVDEIRIQTFKP